MHYYHIIKLISIINNLDRLTNNNIEEIKILIIYSLDDYFTYLNNWQNRYYFIKIFLILFPFGNSRYLAKYKIVILYKI